MSDPVYYCDLCRLPVETSGFDLSTREGDKHFCCEGCLGIFRMLHDDEIVEDVSSAESG